MEIDVERVGLLADASRPAETKQWKVNAAVWSGLGAILLLLILMASLATDHVEAAPTHPLADPPGSIRGCPGNDPLCLIVNAVPTPGYDYRNRPRVATSMNGAVAADQSRCSDIGVDILQSGGNAVDAAVAVALCQGVVNPFASGLGGGHFMLIRLANGSTEVVNAREPAPAAASQDMYKGMPALASLKGGLAIAVPLELRGLALAWSRHGSLPWSQLVLPAAFIARSGFAAHPYLVTQLSSGEGKNGLLQHELMREAFSIPDKQASNGWRIPRVGELCCQRLQLADTLEQIAEHGAEWLYEDERVQLMAAEIQAAGGIITAADLHSAVPTLDVPLQVAVGDLTLLLPPPPSSAAVMGLALAILAGFSEPLATTGLLGTHRMVESMKHGFAVRLAMGDPGTTARPFWNNAALLRDAVSPAFATFLRAEINDTYVLNTTEYGGQWNPLLTNASLSDDHGTTHLSVVDSQRNAVSMTSSVNTVFGSCIISKSTGILFNNQMDDFSRPDAPNTYGLAPSVANYIAPHKRPLSSMSPTVVLEGGKLRMVVGASGGPRIITATLQSIIRVLMLKQAPLAAIEGARVHAQLLPLPVMEEQWDMGTVPLHVDNATLSYLLQRGNSLTPMGQLGNCQAIVVDPMSGRLTGVSDPRKDGAPAAVP